jgi:hypothetical protein
MCIYVTLTEFWQEMATLVRVKITPVFVGEASAASSISGARFSALLTSSALTVVWRRADRPPVAGVLGPAQTKDTKYCCGSWMISSRNCLSFIPEPGSSVKRCRSANF